MEMERVRGTLPAGRPHQLRWKVLGEYLPAAAFALASFLIIRNLVGGDAPASPPTSVDAEHSARLAANIQFFEQRVPETRDNLSYNKLTGLYLQRFRETGDVSDIARADLAARKSLESLPNDYGGLLNLAIVKNVEHDFATALELANQADALVPTRVDAKAVRGDAFFGLGRYEDATADYRAFLEKQPGSSAFSRQASIAEVNGNTPLAEQFWQAAIEADRSDAPETSAWARVQLGTLYFTVGKLEQAEREFDTALKIFPNYHAALAGQGRVAAAKGDYTKAIGKYSDATSRVPVPDYVASLVDLYAAVGKQSDAQRSAGLMAVFDQLYRSNGIRSELSLILYGADHGADPVTNLAAAEAAYAERPGIQAADTLAWALYRAGRLDEAAARSAEALRFGTHDALFEFHAGMIAKARGDIAGHRTHLQNVRNNNPHFSVLHTVEVESALRALEGKN